MANIVALLRQGLLGCSLLLALISPVHATPTDMRVLIDVSGSMRWNDPHNLRVPALRLLTEFLPTDSTAGVWLFAETTELLQPHGLVDTAWRETVAANLGRIHSRGLFTDIEEAILTATADWSTPTDGQTRHLLLLTDGLVDLAAGPEASAESRDRLLNEHILALQDADIQLHGIGLSDEIDTELMQQLSSRTGGWLEIAHDAATLQRIFMHMLEQTATPTTVPLQANRFEIDASIHEFTVVAFHQAEHPIALTTPEGSSIEQGDATDTVRWRSESGYDLITIEAPLPGTWEINAPEDPDNRVMVVTDLGLDMNPTPNALRSGATLSVEAWVTEQGERLQRLDFLGLISATVTLAAVDNHTTSPQASTLRLQPDTGHFTGHLTTTPLPLGIYQLDIQIDGGTFQRQLRRRVQLTGSPVIVTYTPVLPNANQPAARLLADLMIDPQLIHPSSLFGYLRLEGPEGDLTMAEIRTMRGSAQQIELPIDRPGHYQISAHLSARDQHGDHVIMDMETETFSFEFDLATADEPTVLKRLLGLDIGKGDLSWENLLLVIAIGNGLFITLLVLIWLLFRPRGVKATVKESSVKKSTVKKAGVKQSASRGRG